MTTMSSPLVPLRVRVAATGTQIAQSSLILSVSTALVGVLSYLGTILLAHILAVDDYSAFAAAAAMLTSVGVASSALIQLPLAQALRSVPFGSRARQSAVSFALALAAVAGATTAAALTIIALTFTNIVVALATGLTGAAVVALAPAWGWLQGEVRFRAYATLAVFEAILRLGLSLAAAIIGWGAIGAIGGFCVGTAAAAAVGLLFARGELSIDLRVLRRVERWRSTGGIAAVQLVLSVITGADLVFVAALGSVDSTATAGYQAVAALTKAPVYIAAGTVLVTFPLLRAARRHDLGPVLSQALRSFAVMVGAAAAVLATVPRPVALLIVPARYSDALSVVGWLAAAGLGYASVTVFAVIMLALRSYLRCTWSLTAAVILVVLGMLLGWRIDQAPGLAIGAASGAVASTLVAAVLCRPLFPARAATPALRAIVLAALFAAALTIARPVAIVWVVLVLLGGGVVLQLTRRADSAPTGPRTTGRRSPQPDSPSKEVPMTEAHGVAGPTFGPASARGSELERRTLDGFLHRLGRGRTRHRRPRILVIGNVGTGNTGDEALLAVTLRAIGPEADVRVISRDPVAVRTLHDVEAIAMTPRAVAPALLRSDALVVTGGGMFGPGLPPLVRLLPWLLLVAHLARRDTAYLGIGVYSGMPSSTLRVLRWSARRTTSTTVRDHASATLLGAAVSAPCIGDLATFLSPRPRAEALALLERAGCDTSRPILMLSPKASTTDQKTTECLTACTHAAREWDRLGGSVAAIALGAVADFGRTDDHTDAKLIDTVGSWSGVPITRIGPHLDPALAKAAVGACAAVVGLRFHAVVFAATEQVPVLAFPWEPKTAEYLIDLDSPLARAVPNSTAEITSWLTTQAHREGASGR